MPLNITSDHSLMKSTEQSTDNPLQHLASSVGILLQHKFCQIIFQISRDKANEALHSLIFHLYIMGFAVLGDESA